MIFLPFSVQVCVSFVGINFVAVSPPPSGLRRYSVPVVDAVPAAHTDRIVTAVTSSLVRPHLTHRHETRSVGRPSSQRQSGIIVTVSTMSSMASVSTVSASSSSTMASSNHSTMSTLWLCSHIAYCVRIKRNKEIKKSEWMSQGRKRLFHASSVLKAKLGYSRLACCRPASHPAK